MEVELVPSGTRVTCRLGFGNDGVYRIPRVNSEVAVLLPYDPSSMIKDPFDFDPIIVGVLNTEAPAQLTDDTRIILDATEIDAGGTAMLALKQDVADLKSAISTALNALAAGTPGNPVLNTTALSAKATFDSSTSTVPVGTSILRGA